MTHFESLVSLSCTSSSIRLIAARLIFYKISIPVSGRKKLSLDVDQWRKILSRYGCLGQVRQLQLIGAMPIIEQDNAPPRQEGKPLSSENDRVLNEVIQNFEQSTDNETRKSISYDMGTDPREDEAWHPLVALLDSLPRMLDVIYRCDNIFPPCLLDRVERYIPRCKLSLKTFWFEGLHKGRLSEYEYRLASSPCLHEIKARFMSVESRNIQDHNEAAVMRMAAGLTPNLKKISMTLRRLPQNSIPLPSTTSLLASHGCGGASVPFKSGLLTRLSLDCSISLDRLIAWSRHIDFGTLQCLKLKKRVGSQTLRYAAENWSFPSLKELEIDPGRNRQIGQPTIYSLNTQAFMLSLPALQKLRFRGYFDTEIFNSIIGHHGKTLRQLSLDVREYLDMVPRRPTGIWQITKESVEEVQKQCLLLEGLEMPVKRTESEKTELEMYEVFSKFSRLQKLVLILDCSSTYPIHGGTEPPTDPIFDEYHQTVCGNFRLGHIRNAMIKSAVDAHLAKQIWNIISDGKVGVPLQCLNVVPCGGGIFNGRYPQLRIRGIIRELSREYLISRSLRNCTDEVELQELSADRREKWAERMICVDEPLHVFYQVFRRVWPAKDESTPWRDDWSSILLPYAKL